MYRKHLRLKDCPRCGGDILIDQAYEDAEEVCIQCGFYKFESVALDTHPQNEQEKTATVASGRADSKAMN